MASPAASSLEQKTSACSPTVSKKTLSYKYTINDVPMIFTFGKVRSPPFNVLLKGSSSPELSWNSIWHLVFKKGQTDLTVSLCQGWNESGQLATLREHGVQEVLISDCRFKVVNPETEETVYDQEECSPSTYRNRPFMISNEEPAVISMSKKIPYSRYLYKDMLIVQVQADLFFLNNNSANDIIIPPEFRCKNMYSLYKRGKLTDVIVKCEGKEFKVHKAVLASQSPVFLAMFETDMRENQSGIVDISGITSAAMSSLITYLYTGTAPNLKALANELLDVADRYLLSRLFKMCEYELQTKMTVASVVTTLLQADLHGRAKLKKACFEFIRLNTARVFKNREWDGVKNRRTSLYLETLEYCVPKI